MSGDTRFVGTFSMPWTDANRVINATAAEADAALGVTERDFQTNKDLTNVAWMYFPKRLSAIKIRFKLATNDHDVDIDIWTGHVRKNPSNDASQDCSLRRMAVLDVVCGQQDVQGSDTLHYADTIGITSDATYGGIGESAPAENHAKEISFDMKGDNIILFHGYGTFDGDCTVEVSGYA